LRISLKEKLLDAKCEKEKHTLINANTYINAYALRGVEKRKTAKQITKLF